MSEAYQSVRRGLEEALAYAEARRQGAVTHEPRVPEPDAPRSFVAGRCATGTSGR